MQSQSSMQSARDFLEMASNYDLNGETRLGRQLTMQNRKISSSQHRCETKLFMFASFIARVHLVFLRFFMFFSSDGKRAKATMLIYGDLSAFVYASVSDKSSQAARA
jgi:hypothetical protein